MQRQQQDVLAYPISRNRHRTRGLPSAPSSCFRSRRQDRSRSTLTLRSACSRLVPRLRGPPGQLPYPSNVSSLKQKQKFKDKLKRCCPTSSRQQKYLVVLRKYLKCKISHAVLCRKQTPPKNYYVFALE